MIFCFRLYIEFCKKYYNTIVMFLLFRVEYGE